MHVPPACLICVFSMFRPSIRILSCMPPARKSPHILASRYSSARQARPPASKGRHRSRLQEVSHKKIPQEDLHIRFHRLVSPSALQDFISHLGIRTPHSARSWHRRGKAWHSQPYGLRHPLHCRQHQPFCLLPRQMHPLHMRFLLASTAASAIMAQSPHNRAVNCLTSSSTRVLGRLLGRCSQPWVPSCKHM